jgi:putative ATP-dependent endonuclease of OLD family
MYIKKIIIKNFKCLKNFELELDKHLNIIVGANEAGKSTVIEAVHLALSGFLNGKYLNSYELNEYIFNKEAVDKYIKTIKEQAAKKDTENTSAGNSAAETGSNQAVRDPEFISLPEISIEVFIDNYSLFKGDKNSSKHKETGFTFKIYHDDSDNENRNEYQKLISSSLLGSLPVEYYEIERLSFARENIKSRDIPIKSILIDSSSNRYQNVSDTYVTKIVKELLEDEEKIKAAQAYRKMQKDFEDNEAIKNINKKIGNSKFLELSDKNITLSPDLSPRNAWETGIITKVGEIPFHNIGKGEQCLIKTKLSLANKKTKEASILLFEEPENHLSHAKLNTLLKYIKEKTDKQIIITTHSSFVANRLNLKNIVFISKEKEASERKPTKFDNLKKETQEFFEKSSGYDTLRLVLAEKAVLVEGPSDELIFEKAFQKIKKQKISPIETGIDVISVAGLAFKNFLDIAKKINKKVAVITDNDGKTEEEIMKKYSEYTTLFNGRPSGEAVSKHSYNISIFSDKEIDTPNDKNGNINEKSFNYNTLEPKLVKCNNYNIELFNKILGRKSKEKKSKEKEAAELLKFMVNNKTECALKIYNSEEEIEFPEYINEAINFIISNDDNKE